MLLFNYLIHTMGAEQSRASSKGSYQFVIKKDGIDDPQKKLDNELQRQKLENDMNDFFDKMAKADCSKLNFHSNFDMLQHECEKKYKDMYIAGYKMAQTLVETMKSHQ